MFNPVYLQSVQSELFHEWKNNERVDDYAQDLNQLYQKAYLQASQEIMDTEHMGKTVLAYQFVAGLLPDIRMKVAGNEGNFDQLAMKACFEEAKSRDLTPVKQHTKYSGMLTTGFQAGVRSSLDKSGRQAITKKYFVCGQPGHLARDCSLQQRGQPVEAGNHRVMPPIHHTPGIIMPSLRRV